MAEMRSATERASQLAARADALGLSAAEVHSPRLAELLTETAAHFRVTAELLTKSVAARIANDVWRSNARERRARLPVTLRWP